MAIFYPKREFQATTVSDLRIAQVDEFPCPKKDHSAIEERTGHPNLTSAVCIVRSFCWLPKFCYAHARPVPTIKHTSLTIRIFQHIPAISNASLYHLSIYSRWYMMDAFHSSISWRVSTFASPKPIFLHHVFPSFTLLTHTLRFPDTAPPCLQAMFRSTRDWPSVFLEGKRKELIVTLGNTSGQILCILRMGIS